ncbi:MAG: SIMPL domain-containing protein [Anaerolineae bacterium]
MTINRSQLVAGAFVVLLAIAALGISALGPWNSAAAQAEPAAPAMTLPRTITVVGEGTVAVEPDVATVQVGVETTGASAAEASAEASAVMDAVLAALTQLGIPGRDIQTSGFSIWVERPSGPDGQPSGQVIYRVNNSVTVTIRDLSAVGDVLDAVIDAGANNIYGVNFSISDPDKVMAEARKIASENALARAEELAALHGVAVGEVVSISEVIGGGAVPMASINASVAYGGGGGAIAPGELEMTAQLQVVYAIAGPATSAAAPAVTIDRVEPTPAAAAQPPQPAQPAQLASPAVVQETVVEQAVAVEAAPAGSGQLTIRGDDSLLRPFLDRWFSNMYRGMGQDTTLTLGGLPDDLPFELVVPLGAQVLYSLEQDQRMGTQIALHTPLPATEALDYLAARLEEQGYAPNEARVDLGGVLGQPDPGLTLCSPDGEWGVTITPQPTETDSDIDIFIVAAENSACGQIDSPGMGAMRLLPHLTLPAGVQPRFSGMGGGSGGSDRDAYANSMLTVDLSPAELAAHYSQQLQAAGWEQTSESQTDAVDWSVWQFSDERGRPWVGTLLVAERPAQKNALLVQLQIEQLLARD